MLPPRLKMTIVCFHISAVLYLLFGLAMLFFMPLAASVDTESVWFGLILGIFLFALCLALIVGIEVVVWGLTRYKKWAWIAGIIICAIYLPSCYAILGGFGLWGLLDHETKTAFEIRL